MISKSLTSVLLMRTTKPPGVRTEPPMAGRDAVRCGAVWSVQPVEMRVAGRRGAAGGAGRSSRCGAAAAGGGRIGWVNTSMPMHMPARSRAYGTFVSVWRAKSNDL